MKPCRRGACITLVRSPIRHCYKCEWTFLSLLRLVSWLVTKALQQLINHIWLRITKYAGVISKVLVSNGWMESLTIKLVHRIVPSNWYWQRTRYLQLRTPLSWNFSKVLRAIQSPVELTQISVLFTHTRQQPSLTTPWCARCQRQTSLGCWSKVKDDAINWSGYNLMQASKGSVKLSSKNGYKTRL